MFTVSSLKPSSALCSDPSTPTHHVLILLSLPGLFESQQTVSYLEQLKGNLRCSFSESPMEAGTFHLQKGVHLFSLPGPFSPGLQHIAPRPPGLRKNFSPAHFPLWALLPSSQTSPSALVPCTNNISSRVTSTLSALIHPSSRYPSS